MKDKLHTARIEEEKESDDDDEHRKISMEMKNLRAEHESLSFKLAFHNYLFRKILENLGKSQESLKLSLQVSQESNSLLNRLGNETVAGDSLAKIKKKILERYSYLKIIYFKHFKHFIKIFKIKNF